MPLLRDRMGVALVVSWGWTHRGGTFPQDMWMAGVVAFLGE